MMINWWLNIMTTLILIFDYGTEWMYVTYEIKGPSYCQTLFGYLKYQYLGTKLFFRILQMTILFFWWHLAVYWSDITRVNIVIVVPWCQYAGGAGGAPQHTALGTQQIIRKINTSSSKSGVSRLINTGCQIVALVVLPFK